jgi:hypothetical protein
MHYELDGLFVHHVDGQNIGYRVFDAVCRLPYYYGDLVKRLETHLIEAQGVLNEGKGIGSTKTPE